MTDSALSETAGLVALSGGEFLMGSDSHYPDERPLRVATVAPFAIEATPVTNEAFQRFVEETNYVTVAERHPDPSQYPGASREDLVPGSAVFISPSGPVRRDELGAWWKWIPGASWRAPLGPGSDLGGLEDHPVVHIAYEDAITYANAVGRRLPTEAEWEFAARGGLENATFAWGDHDPQENQPLANTWSTQNNDDSSPARSIRTSRVSAYPANGYGIYDMIGNVWEWTSDWYLSMADGRSSCCADDSPSGEPALSSVDRSTSGASIPRKVLKGGSFLCTRRYCFRYRPASRQAQTVDTGLSNCGFRCAISSTAIETETSNR